MQHECLFIHDWSSTIRHSRFDLSVCQNVHVIDHDDIRARLRARFKDLELPPTGKWLKDYGLGQTTIRNFLDGTNQSITVDTVAKLAEPLKTSERWLLFGSNQELNEPELREMVETAVEEIQAGMRIEEIRNTVASALRDQLALHLAVGVDPDTSDAASALGKSSPPHAPTIEDEQAGSRSA